EQDELRRLAAIGNVRVKGQRQQWMVVEDAIGAADHGLAISPWIPGQAYARSDVVDVAGNALGDSQRVLRSLGEGVHRPDFRRELVVITNAVVEREVVEYLPGILQEHAGGV